MIGTSYYWGLSNWAQDKNFSKFEESALGIISQGSSGFADIEHI